MESNLLQEAFKQLEGLEALTEDDINISNPDDELDDFLKSYEVEPDEEEAETIIDPEAETEDELEGSYAGKVILDCCVCHSKIYKDPSEVEVDEEGNVVNLEEECPYCYSTDGFKVIGQIDPIEIPEMGETEDSINLGDVLGDNTTTEDTVGEDTADEEDNLDESLNESNDLYSELASKGVVNPAFNESKNYKHPINDRVTGQYRPMSNDEKIFYQKFKLAMPDEDDEELKEMARAAAYRKSDKVGKGDRKAFYNKLRDESLNEDDDALSESLESATIETDSDTIQVNKEGDSFSINTSEKTASTEGETISPVSPEVQSEIEANSEEPTEDIPDDEYADMDIDDVDEDSFDGVTESYLKEAYNNVKAYKTSSVREKNNKLYVEGVITFKSGNLKATKFIYEGLSTNGKGGVKLSGINENISKDKAFTVNATLKDKRLVTESLSYRYEAKSSSGKNKLIEGYIKR